MRNCFIKNGGTAFMCFLCKWSYIMFRRLLKFVLPLINFLGKQNRIDEIESLRSFVSSRSSYIAQVSLYGYIKTRAGTRYISLIKDPLFASSMKTARNRIFFCLPDGFDPTCAQNNSLPKTAEFSKFRSICPSIFYPNLGQRPWRGFWKPGTRESHPGVRDTIE